MPKIDLSGKSLLLGLAGTLALGTLTLGGTYCSSKRPQVSPSTEIEIAMAGKYSFAVSNTERVDPGIVGGVTCGDLDGDTDLEIIVATSQGITIYENLTLYRPTEQ
ncbi:MAG TPA: hypothetical protein VJK52_04790 [Candidatus Nanoarchaeia archaeon]|nr:hypothetical protein [Candidatus Nanoarchaeia archaeon]